MTTCSRPLAVTFDFGQTLAQLDTALLQRRLLERGVRVDGDRLKMTLPQAWAQYDAVVRDGSGERSWKAFMSTLLGGAGLTGAQLAQQVDWLFEQQPSFNLWRDPIPGMIELVKRLHEGGVRLAVLSNSEGRLAELVQELGWTSWFVAIADSGKLGVEKPDPWIFQWTAQRLGVETSSMVHVGDSLAADVRGALGVGARAIWFGGRPEQVTDDRVRVAHDAAQVQQALSMWGVC